MILTRASELERRYVNIVFFVFGLLIVVAGVKGVVLWYYEKHWNEIVPVESKQLLNDVAEAIRGTQREMRRAATDLARNPAVISALQRPSNLTDLFGQLAHVKEKAEVGVEVYDDLGDLIAWDGISGPSHRREIDSGLKGQMTSFITTSALHTQLFIVTPVRNDSTVVGVVLVRRTIDAHYPLNNKYINREGLVEKVREDLDVTAQFDFSAVRPVQQEDGSVISPLYGIDSTRIGVVSFPSPTLASSHERIGNTFREISGALQFVLIALLTFLVWRRIDRIQPVLWRSLAITVLVWLVRQVLLWVDIPSLFSSSGVFDPVYFASKFGNGMAKSIGELTLSSLALLINVIIVARYILDERGIDIWWHPKRPWVRWTIVVPCVALLFLMFRGYGATIRSAVFDSILLYNDTGVVIPSLELSLMAVNLFMISFSLVAVSVGFTSFLVSLLSHRTGTMVSKYLPWVLTAILFVIASVLLDYLQGHAVVGAMEGLLFSASVLGYCGYLHRQARRNRSLIAPGSLFIALALAAVLFYTLLAAKTHEKDRERIQVFASEFVRPVDSWLTFVIDEGLRMFEDEYVRNTLAGGQRDEIDRLALTLWAKSSACREGYSCLFALFDSSGREMSRFEIGNRNLLDNQSGLWHRLSATQSIHVQQVGAGVNAFKVYRGSVPIRSNGRIIAHGVVVVSAGQQSLFRGESPSFLRSSSPESLESFYRPVTVAEFQHGTLFASTSDIFPHHFLLPAPLRKLLEDNESSSTWGDLSVGGQQYETLFVKGASQDGQIIALCLPAEDIFWYLLSAVKMLWYYFLVVVLALVGYLMLCWWEGHPYQPTFRDKLLIALLVTATLPVVAIAFYGKSFAEQRLMDETAGWLDRETDVLAFQILQELEPEGEKPTDHLTPDAVEEIASDLGTDFNFYVNNELQSTSRPELYAAGLLDPRLSGAAYSSVILNGDKFYHQPENVGLYRYAVGYRAVFDQRGALLGVVSVPTLYRQDELDREVSQQNAFLFGVYAVVFLAITILATTVANRIASPIHHLTEATRKVSRGELDVTLNLGHTDGEIGELVRSFEAMTRDLKRGRDDLVRFERELAWKEMAKQVAHEIKNPLTPMRLSMQHLRQTYRDRVADFDRIIEEVTRTVIEQIDTLSRIASEFSRFGRMPKPSIESCDVNTVVDEAASLFEQQKGVNIERMLEPGLPPVQADREELRRAFINIVRNGIQAMGGRGKMTIRTGMDGSKIMIAIRDFGAGIPDEIKPKLFHPNFSTKTDGMGLGLAIVKNTIDHLQGTIKVESKVREGTEVTILLPVDNRAVGS